MTAILGLNCSDAVIMLADTEETIGENLKSEADKLERFKSLYGPIISGGAGDSDAIDCANHDLFLFLWDRITANSDILRELRNFPETFFFRVIRPFAGFPAIFIPSCEMLIAANSIVRKKTELFYWKETRVFQVPSPIHISIGVGSLRSHSMLRDVEFDPPWSWEAMLIHGIRIVMMTKKTVQGVGGKLKGEF